MPTRPDNYPYFVCVQYFRCPPLPYTPDRFTFPRWIRKSSHDAFPTHGFSFPPSPLMLMGKSMEGADGQMYVQCIRHRQKEEVEKIGHFRAKEK